MFVSILILCISLIATNGENPNNFDRPGVYQITHPLDHAECPTWDPRTNNLYFVDIFKGLIYSYNFDSRQISSIKLNGAVAPVIQSKNDPYKFIAGLDKTIVEVQWNGSTTIDEANPKILTEIDQGVASRLNDGKADKEGRIWFGTMGFDDADGPVGSLYKIEKIDGAALRATNMITPVGTSNGMAWNKANDKLYYIDTPTKKITQYDYDNLLGQISNAKTIFNLDDHNLEIAAPDGMTIDKDDNLWVALYGGGSVIKVNPSTGELSDRIPIPATDVTSVMWGGPILDVLFVTTSRLGLSEDQRVQQPAAGSVFAITNTGTAGLPVFQADLS